jgi:hypothetical protein
VLPVFLLNSALVPLLVLISPRAPRYSPVAPSAQGHALGGFPRQDDARQALNSRRRLDQELALHVVLKRGLAPDDLIFGTPLWNLRPKI